MAKRVLDPAESESRRAKRGERSNSPRAGNGQHATGEGNDGGARNTPQPRALDHLKRILQPIASLWLTVPLLAMAVALVFVGTIAQTTWNEGIWAVQKDYFHSFIIWAGPIPLPGGFAIGTVLMVNLVAAHAVRFHISWKRAGILLIHAGVVMLLANEVLTSLTQVEMQTALAKGESKNWAQNYQDYELAIVDASDPQRDSVVTIPASRLKQGARITDAALPFEVEVNRWVGNAELKETTPGNGIGDREYGNRYTVESKPVNRDMERLDFPAAVVTLYDHGHRLGTWLTSIWLDPAMSPSVRPQSVDVNGKRYILNLRFRRYYQEFAIELINYETEKYQGIDKPRAFTSWVRVLDANHNEVRKATISMNEPLRFGGVTYFNGRFDPETVTFQVVRNPGSFAAYMPGAVVDNVPLYFRYFLTVPGIGLALVGVGLLTHFGMHLTKFLSRRVA